MDDFEGTGGSELRIDPITADISPEDLKTSPEGLHGSLHLHHRHRQGKSGHHHGEHGLQYETVALAR